MTAGRLLILDDEPQIGQTIRFIAESVGLEATATDQAVEFFHELESWQPTHIALDLVMPDMDGVEVIAALGRMGCTARIIITSGVGNRVLEAAGRSASEHGLNIVGVLSKPFSPAALRKLLTESPQPATIAPASRPLADRRHAISPEDLERAVHQRQLVMAYQPKVECASGRVCGFEALVRWDHPQHGIIMPDSFIPMAEDMGMINDLTAVVLEESLTWFTGLLDSTGSSAGGQISLLPRDASLAINLSALSLREPELADRLAGLCAGLGIRNHHVIFEITETSAMEDPVASLDLLTRLRMKGFQLSIDDFGTGFSSMLQLVRLPFSEIKVDKSFVINAIDSAESRTVVRSIIDLGQSLGLQVTAEGVENAATLELLRQQRCDLAQGYHIARPMWGEDVRDWLRAR